MSGAVERAVRRDLRRLPREDRTSAMAAAALELARLLDGEAKGDEGADAKWLGAAAQAARELRTTMTELLKNAPRETTDDIDDLRARRKARRPAAG